MKPESKIYVAGHRGLVGGAIMRRLQKGGYRNLLTRSHAEFDLTNQQAVNEFFQCEKPEYVVLAAAKVGGIHANNTYPAEFIYQNLMIEANIIHAAYLNQVKKLLFLGSSCIYPKHAPQPMREEHLLTGLLEPTNEPYALAKIAGIKMCGAYNRQYGTNFISVMPTNLYGPGDNYHLQNSHVIPALIRKAHEAKEARASRMIVWGSGNARREFLYSDDLADASVFLMEKKDAEEIGEFINIGVGTDLSIAKLAATVASIVGFKGDLVFDKTKPDGTPQKVLDVSRLHALGWHAKVDLEAGLKEAYQDFLSQPHPTPTN